MNRRTKRDFEKRKEELNQIMLDSPATSEEYEKAFKQYNELVKLEEESKKNSLAATNSRFGGVFGGLIKILSLGVAILGTVIVPLKLADRAYEGEAQMERKNGSIWNLIGKDFTKKQ